MSQRLQVNENTELEYSDGEENLGDDEDQGEEFLFLLPECSGAGEGEQHERAATEEQHEQASREETSGSILMQS